MKRTYPMVDHLWLCQLAKLPATGYRKRYCQLADAPDETRHSRATETTAIICVLATRRICGIGGTVGSASTPGLFRTECGGVVRGTDIRHEHRKQRGHGTRTGLRLAKEVADGASSSVGNQLPASQKQKSELDDVPEGDRDGACGESQLSDLCALGLVHNEVRIGILRR
jgi:hypothetical protein